jgi:DNA-binding transcriptional ArsR family regulator
MGNSEYFPFTVPAMKIDTAAVIRFTRATKHPLRIAILQRLEQIPKASPKELSEYFGESLGVAAYHVGELNNVEAIVEVERIPRRGAAEHFYSLTDYGRTTLQAARYITKKAKAAG